MENKSLDKDEKMSKAKYHFNPQTLSYEKIKLSRLQVAKKVIFHFLSSVSIGILLFLLFSAMFDSPHERQLQRENRQLKSQYKIMNHKLGEAQEMISVLESRDENIYRVILGAEPFKTVDGSRGEYDANRYNYLEKLSDQDLVYETEARLHKLRRQVYDQIKSYKDIVHLGKNNKNRLECIPAIQPVFNRDLKHMASGYGVRVDPVYHTRKFHAGMDFAADRGTKIFATGNGRVIFAGWKQGYGKCVIVNHGYGYQTLYGHMSAIKARQGQQVKRGDVIGFVGSTGKSTGPHLHYEVIVNGKNVNPAQYYYLDLSPAEYDKMLQMTANNARVMD